MPVLESEVLSVGSSSGVDDDTEDDQTDDSDNFDDCEPEFSFTVTMGREETSQIIAFKSSEKEKLTLGNLQS